MQRRRSISWLLTWWFTMSWYILPVEEVAPMSTTFGCIRAGRKAAGRISGPDARYEKYREAWDPTPFGRTGFGPVSPTKDGRSRVFGTWAGCEIRQRPLPDFGAKCGGVIGKGPLPIFGVEASVGAQRTGRGPGSTQAGLTDFWIGLVFGSAFKPYPL